MFDFLPITVENFIPVVECMAWILVAWNCVVLLQMMNLVSIITKIRRSKTRKADQYTIGFGIFNIIVALTIGIMSPDVKLNVAMLFFWIEVWTIPLLVRASMMSCLTHAGVNKLKKQHTFK